MSKTVIFYGAGWYAEKHLDVWLKQGIKPVCFADMDNRKHYTTIRSNGGKELEILPIEEALRHFPKADICITAGRSYWSQIYDELIAKGIAATQIFSITENGVFLAALGYPQHCSLIGTNIIFSVFHKNSIGMRTCCMADHGMSIPMYGTIYDSLEHYYEFCEKLNSNLDKGILTCCTGCSMLKDGRSGFNSQLQTVSLGTGLPGGKRCNFRCIYCDACDNAESLTDMSEKSYNVFEILQCMGEISSVDEMWYGAGEIAISPYRQQILDIWNDRKWKGTIFTNAAIYIDELRALLNRYPVKINCSLDAGTAETFARVKSVNCFDVVVENLKKYATAGKECIDLKYIVLDEINCDSQNIDGFISIARSTNARVVISRDLRIASRKMSDCEYAAVTRLAQMCITQNIQHSFNDLVFYTDSAKLKRDGIWG